MLFVQMGILDPQPLEILMSRNLRLTGVCSDEGKAIEIASRVPTILYRCHSGVSIYDFHVYKYYNMNGNGPIFLWYQRLC
ncbi:hypothetical protein NC651_000365 [Populus alba x Populus x berolinensis]|nr:hypothetical protein NC651_000365 [Populus alba x Populus x berolinensis]